MMRSPNFRNETYQNNAGKIENKISYKISKIKFILFKVINKFKKIKGQ